MCVCVCVCVCVSVCVCVCVCVCVWREEASRPGVAPPPLGLTHGEDLVMRCLRVLVYLVIYDCVRVHVYCRWQYTYTSILPLVIDPGLTSLGGVPQEQKMLKGRLPRVMYHQVY